jgi:hypothetical protein
MEQVMDLGKDKDGDRKKSSLARSEASSPTTGLPSSPQRRTRRNKLAFSLILEPLPAAVAPEKFHKKMYE